MCSLEQSESESFECESTNSESTESDTIEHELTKIDTTKIDTTKIDTIERRYNSEFFALLPAEIFAQILSVLGPLGKALLASSNKDYFKMCYSFKMILKRPSNFFIYVLEKIFDTGLHSLQIIDPINLYSKTTKMLFTSKTLQIKELTFGVKKSRMNWSYHPGQVILENSSFYDDEHISPLIKLKIFGFTHEGIPEHLHKILQNLKEYSSNCVHYKDASKQISKFCDLPSSQNNMECFEFVTNLNNVFDCHKIMFEALKKLPKLKKLNFRYGSLTVPIVPYFIHIIEQSLWRSNLTHLKLYVVTDQKCRFLDNIDLQNLGDINPLLTHLDLGSCTCLGITFRQIIQMIDSKLGNLIQLILPMYLYDANILAMTLTQETDVDGDTNDDTKQPKMEQPKPKREIIVDFYCEKNARARIFFDDWIIPDKTLRLFL